MTSLSDRMDFDHVVTVHADGSVTDGPENLWAPELHDGELESSSEWELLRIPGSAQYCYAGPIMHNSEYIGGKLERDILATPGHYVSLVCYWTNDSDETEEDNAEGWAIARYIGDDDA